MECRGALLCVLVLFGGFPAVTGHAFLNKPAARNVVAQDTCKHCLQSGGPDTVHRRGGGVWPTRLAPGSHGLCGDPVQNRDETLFKDEPYMKSTAVQATYTGGTVVEFQIGVSTHHMGHYEFRICDRALDVNQFSTAAEGQQCLDQWLLKRAPPASDCVANGPADCQPLDEDHPERWYLPPPNHGTQVAGSDWNDNDAYSSADAGEYHNMRYEIPAGLSCSHCTLQWYWSTGNTCLYDEGYITYFKRMQSLGWDASAWAPHAVASWATKASVTCGPEGKNVFGEEFWNCADIEILPSGPTPPPTPAPPTPPTPQPVVAAPTPAPAPCTPVYGQCGGGSTPSTCCEPGSYCRVANQWYHQCVPGLDPNLPSPTPAPAPAPTPSPPVSYPAPGPSPGGTCGCNKTTPWDGGFGRFASTADFCVQDFGGSNPYISAGGGAGSSGGFSGPAPCTSEQYSFSEDGTWTITVDGADAQGKIPYRAFAYAQFCNGQPYRDCWGSAGKVSFSFSFRVEGMEQMGAFVKLLFWTDAGNILGLLPPQHPKGNGQMRLLAFMQDDYPNSWAAEASVKGNSWQHVQVEFAPASGGVSLFLNGVRLADGSIPVQMLDASNGPQLGVYSFDFGGGSWPQHMRLQLNDVCVGVFSGQCPSGGGPAPSTTLATTSTRTTTLSLTAATTSQPGSSSTLPPSTVAATTSRVATTTLPPATTTSESADFEAVDGGVARACRGADQSDNSASHYSVSQADSLDVCMGLCRSTSACKGIEFSDTGRCEVWTRAGGIQASVGAGGYTCLRYLRFPEPEPEPEPEVGCEQLCGFTDVTATAQQCRIRNNSQEECSKGYIRKGDFVVPCAWTGCGCFADGAGLLQCPGLPSTCTALLQAEKPVLTSAAGKLALFGRSKLRTGRSQLTVGMAFIQGTGVSVQRTGQDEEEAEVPQQEEL